MAQLAQNHYNGPSYNIFSRIQGKDELHLFHWNALIYLSHYLNQCWLINACRWHLAESNFTETALDITHHKVFEEYIFENTATFSRGQ